MGKKIVFEKDAFDEYIPKQLYFINFKLFMNVIINSIKY